MLKCRWNWVIHGYEWYDHRSKPHEENKDWECIMSQVENGHIRHFAFLNNYPSWELGRAAQINREPHNQYISSQERGVIPWSLIFINTIPLPCAFWSLAMRYWYIVNVKSHTPTDMLWDCCHCCFHLFCFGFKAFNWFLNGLVCWTKPFHLGDVRESFMTFLQTVLLLPCNFFIFL